MGNGSYQSVKNTLRGSVSGVGIVLMSRPDAKFILANPIAAPSAGNAIRVSTQTVNVGGSGSRDCLA